MNRDRNELTVFHLFLLSSMNVTISLCCSISQRTRTNISKLTTHQDDKESPRPLVCPPLGVLVVSNVGGHRQLPTLPRRQRRHLQHGNQNRTQRSGEGQEFGHRDRGRHLPAGVAKDKFPAQLSVSLRRQTREECKRREGKKLKRRSVFFNDRNKAKRCEIHIKAPDNHGLMAFIEGMHLRKNRKDDHCVDHVQFGQEDVIPFLTFVKSDRLCGKPLLLSTLPGQICVCV